jgi:hypothetical protein
MLSGCGVIELALHGRGPKQAFVFDPHRLALPCWAAAGAQNALLITLDRHFDTVPPTHPPERGWPLERLVEHTQRHLDPRNVDHVLAAMEAGLVGDALVIARAHPPGSVGPPQWRSHALIAAPSLDALLNGPDAKRAVGLVERASAVLLDIDLDCFTSPSDADPTTVIPWPLELIRDHVLPRGSDAFWDAALAKCIALTFAREPKHTGGLVASGRLFEQAAEVVFRELLHADLP